MIKSQKTMSKKIISELYGLSTLMIMVFVMLIFTVINKASDINFLSASNLSVILNQSCFLMIAGVAQCIVILTGGINLSIGAVMAFSTVLWGGLLLKDATVIALLPFMLILLTGAFIGFINGILITKLKIPPFIATFAVMYSCRGLAWVYLRNRVLYPLNESFRVIAMGRLFTIGGFTVTFPMVIAFLVLLIAFIVLKFTNFGRKIYFTGANPVAAKFSGINTDKLIIVVYIISSILASFAGLMYVARLNAAEPGLATKTHFESITISLIAGFAMSGGYGNVWAIAGGAIVVYTIQSGMNSLQLPSELQTLVNGLMIIFAVFLNQLLINKKMELDNDLEG